MTICSLPLHTSQQLECCLANAFICCFTSLGVIFCTVCSKRFLFVLIINSIDTTICLLKIICFVKDSFHLVKPIYHVVPTYLVNFFPLVLDRLVSTLEKVFQQYLLLQFNHWCSLSYFFLFKTLRLKVFHFLFYQVSLATGFLFLGGGMHTFSTSNSSIAALLITLYPRLPTGPNDNRCHLQVNPSFQVQSTLCMLLMVSLDNQIMVVCGFLRLESFFILSKHSYLMKYFFKIK